MSSKSLDASSENDLEAVEGANSNENDYVSATEISSDDRELLREKLARVEDEVLRKTSVARAPSTQQKPEAYPSSSEARSDWIENSSSNADTKQAQPTMSTGADDELKPAPIKSQPEEIFQSEPPSQSLLSEVAPTSSKGVNRIRRMTKRGLSHNNNPSNNQVLQRPSVVRRSGSNASGASAKGLSNNRHNNKGNRSRTSSVSSQNSGGNYSDDDLVIQEGPGIMDGFPDPFAHKVTTVQIPPASHMDNNSTAESPPLTSLTLDDHYSAPGGYAVGGPAPYLTPTPSVHNDEEFDDEIDNRRGDESVLVEATLVPDEQPRSFRLANTASSIVVEAKPLSMLLSNRLVVVGILLLIVVIVALAVGLGVGGSNNNAMENSVVTMTTNTTASPTAAPVPTLQRIRDTGMLRCGFEQTFKTLREFLSELDPHHEELAASANLNVPSQYQGFRGIFDLGLCQAIAWAINGENATFEAYAVTASDKHEMLLNGTIDVIVTKAFLSMENDLAEPTTGEGFSYSTSFISSGNGFCGLPHNVECAENGINTIGNCSDTVMCVLKGSAFRDDLERVVPQGRLLPKENPRELLLSFIAGSCNVVASETFKVFEMVLRPAGYQGEFATGTREATRELWAMATREDDTEWANFVNTVILGLVAAEERGITKETADDMGEVHLFGGEPLQYSRMLINAVKAVGNLGNLYDKSIGWILPRLQINHVNNGTTGLLFSSEFGDEVITGPGPREGGVLETVLQRGSLRCGVRPDRPGFATFDVTTTTAWKGFGVDYCVALASSLFQGRPNSVEFVNVISASEGFEALQGRRVDVLAGSVWTIQNNMREPTTQQSYSFTKPYFYGPVRAATNATRSFDENLCLATRQDDPQWSSFVYWTAQSIVYAEEHGITQLSSSNMPLTNLFGADLTRMFRDAVHAVGNFAQVYARNLEPRLPRGGRNRLTRVGDNTPLLYVPPGFD
ncbi:extracellular solute-binding protein [Seminavis robusta]|uniref:Extracellular solute-binding protein n=1 Tax=Seminavis robusta TaxID=568900 RepID=A0A9N8EFG2_9STRA|nr:extracellular solute-binding protein [Seminavis robusta]|eukprot:Sro859_g211980.1 extracellular solute-binding protein (961) ;mRNA; r:19543-22587